MHLSHLLIDVGTNPDRPRPGRLWLRNVYHVHQRLCMAFPSDPRKATDPGFLKPFRSEDFGDGQVHVERAVDSGFLFRIDPHLNGRAVILVQSAMKPDWGYAFHNAGHLLAAPPEVRQLDPRFTRNQRLRFRLVANPTRRLSRNSPGAREESVGKRVPVPSDQLFDWLARRAEAGGCSIDEGSATIQPGYIYFKKPDKKWDGRPEAEQKDEKARLRSVRYEGLLTVTNPDNFRNALIHGVGSGKAFGFGLLSIVPVR